VIPIPIGDYPNPPKPQWVTRIIIIVNVAIHVFVAMPMENEPLDRNDLKDPEKLAAIRILIARTTQEDPDRVLRDQVAVDQWLSRVSRYTLFTQMYGYKPAMPTLASLFLCMFLHGGFLHIFGNMLFLWIFGDNVEYRLGPVGYLFAYLGTGVIATLSFAFLNQDSVVPLVGASGAISGVLGFYLLWFPHNQVRVLIIFFFITIIHVRALWVLGFYLIVDNLLPFLREQRLAESGGVAHAAHIGGFLGGLAIGLAYNMIRGATPPPRPGVGPSPIPQRMRPPPAVVREDPGVVFTRSIAAGRMEDAAHAFARLAREGGSAPAADDVFKLARWLYDQEFTPDAAAVFRYYVRNYPRGEDLDRVHLGLGILLARRLSQPSAAREHLLQAIDLGDGTVAATARAELEALGG